VAVAAALTMAAAAPAEGAAVAKAAVEGPDPEALSSKTTHLPFLWSFPRRILRSSRPQEIFQLPQQEFYSVHAQLQLLGNIHTSPHLNSPHTCFC
jgi:hypothetical protein